MEWVEMRKKAQNRPIRRFSVRLGYTWGGVENANFNAKRKKFRHLHGGEMMGRSWWPSESHYEESYYHSSIAFFSCNEFYVSWPNEEFSHGLWAVTCYSCGDRIFVMEAIMKDLVRGAQIIYSSGPITKFKCQGSGEEHLVCEVKGEIVEWNPPRPSVPPSRV